MLYEVIVQLIGDLPLEFHFIYGLVTMVASVFGILSLFSPILLCYKLVSK